MFSSINASPLPMSQQTNHTQVDSSTSLLCTQETQSFWEQLLKGIHKPNAKRLIDQLDLSNPMGVRVLPGRRTGKAPLYPYFLKVKHDHPRKIVLVRVSQPLIRPMAAQTSDLQGRWTGCCQGLSFCAADEGPGIRQHVPKDVDN